MFNKDNLFIYINLWISFGRISSSRLWTSYLYWEVMVLVCPGLKRRRVLRLDWIRPTLTCLYDLAGTELWTVKSTELTECKISNIPFEILWSFKLQTRDSRDEKTNKIKLQSFLFQSFPRQIRPRIILKFHPTNKQSDSIKYIFHKINESVRCTV